jgi:betaine-aldehyde dehydrogenase
MEQATSGATSSKRAAEVHDRYQSFIDGQWLEGTGGEAAVIDPTTEEELALVTMASVADVNRAVETADQAARTWRTRSWTERAALLGRLADELEARSGEFARLDALDGGIPIQGARRDVINAVSYLRYFAHLASELKGHSLESHDGFTFTVREPYGAVARIVPFNHPLQFAAAAISAPLAAGNAVVLKPAEQTPISALHLAELAADILPAGLFNVVNGGAEVGSALIGHPKIERVGFTGSTRAARAVLRTAADGIKKVTLELGGKNPLVVLPDVEPDVAAERALIGMNLARTAGQSCGSTSRIYAPRALEADFVGALAERFRAQRLGDPLDEDTQVGPLAFAAHYERVRGYVAAGRDEGATLVCGGVRPSELKRGYFLSPALFASVRDEMRIASEEIFGPVASVLAWDRQEELLERANALPFGLTANIITNDLSAATELARKIEAGYIWVNGRGQRPFGAPFGGYKLSGLGEENSLAELMSYTRQKNVSLNPLGE